MEKVIIIGSSRKQGNTKKVVDELQKFADWNIINLTHYDISYYDYEHKNKNDDFLCLM